MEKDESQPALEKQLKERNVSPTPEPDSTPSSVTSPLIQENVRKFTSKHISK